MDSDELIFEKEGARAWVSFNRPHRHNAINFSMYRRLEAVCDEIDADPDIRVVIFRGLGDKAFVAGTEIGEFQDFKSPEDASAYEARIDGVVGRLERLGASTIAMLQGVCAGGGVPIALACDFRYADPGLRFGVPIARTLGNCLSISNVARLIDFLGVSRTKEILMLGKMLAADEARAIGLVNEVCPAADLASAVDALADSLLALAPLSLRASKVAIRRALESRRPSREFSEDLIRMCYGSRDFESAVAAFLNKRPPQWQGK